LGVDEQALRIAQQLPGRLVAEGEAALRRLAAVLLQEPLDERG
jgi:hypothetical protein